MRRAPVRLLLAPALLLAIALWPNAASVAAPTSAAGPIALSLDRNEWSSALQAPLFPAGQRWVPGDQAVRSFYVRDDGRTAADLTVTVITHVGRRLLASGDVALSARVDAGAWTPVVEGAELTRVVGPTLARSGVARVDVRVALPWSSPNRSQLRRWSFDLRVTLRQATAGNAPGPAGPRAPDAVGPALPDTGADLPRWLPWLGGALLGGGLVLVASSRRRRSHG